MAVTTKSDVTNQIPALWSTDLYSQAENMTFWSGIPKTSFMGFLPI